VSITYYFSKNILENMKGNTFKILYYMSTYNLFMFLKKLLENMKVNVFKILNSFAIINIINTNHSITVIDCSGYGTRSF